MCQVKIKTELVAGHMQSKERLIYLRRVLYGNFRDVFKTHGLIGSKCALLQFVSFLFYCS